MNWITNLRQRSLWLLFVIALVLSLSLAACGKQADASNTATPNSYSTSQQQQYQPNQSTRTHSNNGTMQSTDQQVQSILRQLDGAKNDVNSSDSASSQDNGQQP